MTAWTFESAARFAGPFAGRSDAKNAPMAPWLIHPDYRPALEAARLADFGSLWRAAEGRVLDGHPTRDVARVEVPRDDGEPLVLYVKRAWARGARRHGAEILLGRRPMVPARREWRNARRLAAAGVPIATPVAFGRARGPDGPRTLLAFEEVRGPSLAAWIQERTPGAGPSPRRIARAVADTVRRLHDAAFAYTDLYAKHLFLESFGTDAPRAVFIDPMRVRRLTPARRVRDLAALAATTREPGVARTDRLRFFLAYSGLDRLDAAAKRLVRSVEREAARLAGRGRDPNLLPFRRTAPPGMVPLAEESHTVLDGGRLRVLDAFRPHLERAGLVTLDALMTYGGGEPYRVVPGRSTVRAELEGPAGSRVALYLKRHTRVPWTLKVRRTVGLGQPVSQARREVQGIVRLTDLGIPTMRLAALGEAFEAGGRIERSCLVTEEIGGATQADDDAEARFGPGGEGPTAEKRRLVRKIGRLARTLHGAGFVHRDFYLCHILVRPVEGGGEVLHLIDLQRLGRRPGGAPRRWIVKDLAALLFSSWPSPATGIRSRVFTETDRMRFAVEYFGTRRLDRRAKSILRAAARKARRIARREARRRARAKP